MYFLLFIFYQVTLNNYSFENVAFHVLHQRFPLYSPRTLSDWFDHNTDLHRWAPHPPTHPPTWLLSLLHHAHIITIVTLFGDQLF